MLGALKRKLESCHTHSQIEAYVWGGVSLSILLRGNFAIIYLISSSRYGNFPVNYPLASLPVVKKGHWSDRIFVYTRSLPPPPPLLQHPQTLGVVVECRMSRWAHVMCRAPVYGKVSPYYNRSYCGDWKVVNVLTSSLSPPPPTYVLPPPSLSCHNVSDFSSQVSSLSSSHNLSPPHLQHHFLAAPVIPNAIPCLTPSLHGFSAAPIITTMMMMWQSPWTGFFSKWKIISDFI